MNPALAPIGESPVAQSSLNSLIFAEVSELADEGDLKSPASKREGSNPFFRTKSVMAV